MDKRERKMNKRERKMNKNLKRKLNKSEQKIGKKGVQNVLNERNLTQQVERKRSVINILFRFSVRLRAETATALFVAGKILQSPNNAKRTLQAQIFLHQT